MCQTKSGIILKDRVFVPDYDSHSQMLEELNIKDNGKNIDFIRAELVPPNGDVFTDIDGWTFIVDQDITPEWYVSGYDKQRMITAVTEWAKKRIFIGIDNLKICDGAGYYLKDCKDVVLYGSSTVQGMYDSSTVRRMYDNSTVQGMYDSSTVQEMYDNSTVQEMYGSSTVQGMYDSSTVRRMYDSSTVQEMYGSSTVRRMYDSSTVVISEHCASGVDATKTILCNNATIKDNRAKTIYQAGNWKLVTVK